MIWLAMQGHASYMKEIWDRIAGPVPKPEEKSESIDWQAMVSEANRRAEEHKASRKNPNGQASNADHH
jgi:hypothetical protein